MLQFWDRLYLWLKRGTEITRERSWEKNPRANLCAYERNLTKCSSSVTCSLNRSAAGDQEGQELRSRRKYKGRSRGFPRVNELLRFSFDLEILEIIHIGPPKALLNIGGKTFLSYPAITSKSFDFSVEECLKASFEIWFDGSPSQLQANTKGLTFTDLQNLIIIIASDRCATILLQHEGKRQGSVCTGFFCSSPEPNFGNIEKE